MVTSVGSRMPSVFVTKHLPYNKNAHILLRTKLEVFDTLQFLFALEKFIETWCVAFPNTCEVERKELRINPVKIP